MTTATLGHTRAGAVWLGVVVDVEDPAGQGRVRVRFPFLGNDTPSGWAPIASAMAGNDYGTWFIPEVGDEAVVVFDRGDTSQPIVLGFLWNGVDRAPSTAVRERMIRSVNGHTIRLLDSTPTQDGNRGAVVVEDASGNQIVLTNGKVSVRSIGVLELEGAVIVLNTAGVRRIVSPSPNSI
jgi:phage baseplate assembly protein V